MSNKNLKNSLKQRCLCFFAKKDRRLHFVNAGYMSSLKFNLGFEKDTVILLVSSPKTLFWPVNDLGPQFTGEVIPFPLQGRLPKTVIILQIIGTTDLKPPVTASAELVIGFH